MRRSTRSPSRVVPFPTPPTPPTTPPALDAAALAQGKCELYAFLAAHPHAEAALVVLLVTTAKAAMRAEREHKPLTLDALNRASQ
jgi:hypothetical protein